MSGNNGDDQKNSVVRKKSNNKRRTDYDGVMQPIEEKKQRIRWDSLLHGKFVDAVVELGGEDKAVPNKIHQIMNVEGLTRESVASHLQQYRKSKKMNFGVDQCDNRKKLLIQNNSSNGISTSVADSEQQSGTVGCCSTVSPRYLSTVNNVIGGTNTAGFDNSQLNNQWRVNHVNNQQLPRQLEVKPAANQVVMQQPRIMHFGRNFVGVDNFMLANHHIQQQQQQQKQQQNHMLYRDIRPLNSGYLHNVADKQHEFFDPICENNSGNSISISVADSEQQSMIVGRRSAVSPCYLSNTNVIGGTQAPGFEYSQLNNQWMGNHVINHQLPQQLEVKPAASQVVMQQPRMMNFGRNFMGVDNFMRANHHIQQQQQQQQNHMLCGDFRPFNSGYLHNVADKQVNDEFFDPIRFGK